MIDIIHHAIPVPKVSGHSALNLYALSSSVLSSNYKYIRRQNHVHIHMHICNVHIFAHLLDEKKKRPRTTIFALLAVVATRSAIAAIVVVLPRNPCTRPNHSIITIISYYLVDESTYQLPIVESMPTKSLNIV